MMALNMFRDRPIEKDRILRATNILCGFMVGTMSHWFIPAVIFGTCKNKHKGGDSIDS